MYVNGTTFHIKVCIINVHYFRVGPQEEVQKAIEILSRATGGKEVFIDNARTYALYLLVD
ncbi:UNVERIFIED_ORG: hypothetical protein ABIC97_005459 [Peribacillus simplex]